jgi:hypothetical protein
MAQAIWGGRRCQGELLTQPVEDIALARADLISAEGRFVSAKSLARSAACRSCSAEAGSY